MAVPPFRPPVYEPLHEFGWPRPRGNTEYRVTQTFDHINAAISPYPHHALDLGNGTSGDALFAPAAGTIVAEGWLREPWSQSATQAQAKTWHSPYPSGWGGIMVVIDHGGGWYSGLAHMSRTIVNAGQKVAAGQQVGNLGGTGAAAGVAHCHWDLYRTVDGKRVKVDAWPLLEQNYVAPLPDTSIEDDMKLTKSLIGKTAYIKGNGYIHRSPDAFESSRVFQVGPDGSNTGRALIGTVEGVSTYGDSTWYVYVLGTDLRYFHASQLTDLKDWAGPSQGELDALNTRIHDLTSALTLANGRLTQHQQIGGPVAVPK